MLKKIIAFIIFFYFLAILQTSFMVHLRMFGIVPNLVLIAVAIFNLFTPQCKWRQGLIAALIGGFYLDVFSFDPGLFFGIYTIISIALASFIQLVPRKHVQIPTFRKI